MQTLTLSSDGTPADRGYDDTAVYWHPEDSTGAPFGTAHVHHSAGVIPLTDVKVSGVPVSDTPLVGMLPWDAMTAAVTAHFPNGWETLLLVGTSEDGQQVMVSMPTQALDPDVDGVPEGFAFGLSDRLNTLYLAGEIDVVEDNLDRILDIALPPDDSDLDDSDPDGSSPDPDTA